MVKVLTDTQALKNIAANVAALRGKRSRSWLAERVGTYPINITRIERGENMPGAALLSRLAEALETTMEKLISEPAKKSRKTG